MNRPVRSPRAVANCTPFPSLQRVLASAGLGTAMLATGCRNPFLEASIPRVAVTRDTATEARPLANRFAGLFTDGPTVPVVSEVPPATLHLLTAVTQAVSPAVEIGGSCPLPPSPSVMFKYPTGRIHYAGGLRRVRP